MNTKAVDISSQQGSKKRIFTHKKKLIISLSWMVNSSTKSQETE